MKLTEEMREYFRAMGKKGQQETLRKYGPEFHKKIRKGIKPKDELEAAKKE